MRRLAVALIALAALVAVPSALAAKPAVKPSYLFAMTSTGGALKHDASGWWIELTGTSPLVTRFSDRPNRLASTLSPAQLAAQWRGYGFAGDPPNAALVLDGRPADADVFVVELRHPSVTGSTVRFRARPIRDTSSALSRYAKRGDRLRETRFGNASLFIDDGADITYQSVVFTVTNVGPTEGCTIYLGNGIFVAGTSMLYQPLGYPGLQIQSVNGGSVALLQLTENTDRISVELQQTESLHPPFTITAFVAMENTSTFIVSTPGCPGVSVTAQTPGGPPQSITSGDYYATLP